MDFHFSIVGLGDTAISESKDRVRTALKIVISKWNLKIIVNFPAGIKRRSSIDLPIAVVIMVAIWDL